MLFATAIFNVKVAIATYLMEVKRVVIKQGNKLVVIIQNRCAQAWKLGRCKFQQQIDASMSLVSMMNSVTLVTACMFAKKQKASLQNTSDVIALQESINTVMVHGNQDLQRQTFAKMQPANAIINALLVLIAMLSSKDALMAPGKR